MKSRVWAVRLALLGLAAAVSGCGGGGAGTGSAGKTDKLAPAGPGPYVADASQPVQDLYKANCMACHGNNLEGKVGPKTNLQQVGSRRSKEQIEKQIASGGGGMPAFGPKLKPEDLSALTDWLAGKK